MRVWQIAEKCWTVASDGGREGGEGESVIVLSVSDWCETDGGERGGEIRKVATAAGGFGSGSALAGVLAIAVSRPSPACAVQCSSTTVAV